MTDIIVQIIFGWPAIITSILLSIVGILLKKRQLLVIAGFIGIPFAAYLTAGSHLPGLLLPVFQLGSAFAVKHQKTLVAWLLIVPTIVSALMLAYVVLTQ